MRNRGEPIVQFIWVLNASKWKHLTPWPWCYCIRIVFFMQYGNNTQNSNFIKYSIKQIVIRSIIRENLCSDVCMCILNLVVKWRASLVPQLVKNPFAMQETLVRFLDWEDPLEKEMATHFNILVWRSPWTEEPEDRLRSVSHRVGHDWVTDSFRIIVMIVRWWQNLHTWVYFTVIIKRQNPRSVIHGWL